MNKDQRKHAPALKTAPHLTLDNMRPRFDWAEQMNLIVTKIREWNR